jgi:hypothetical protein
LSATDKKFRFDIFVHLCYTANLFANIWD